MAIVSLNAAAAPGAGAVLACSDPRRDATMFAVCSSGFTTLLTLEGTIDGTNWVEVGASAIRSGGYVNTRQGCPLCVAFRANLKSITGGTVTASILISGGPVT